MNWTSDSIDLIAPALLKAQIAMKGAKKDKVNPHLKNAYADLASVFEACKGPLNDAGIAIIQPMVLQPTNGKNAMTTVLLHESGQYVSCGAFLPDIDQKGINAAQAMGSAISYMRRYQLSAMAGVLQEDDDGNAAGVKAEPAEQKPAMEPFLFNKMISELETADNEFHMKKRWDKPEFQAGFKTLGPEAQTEIRHKKDDMKTVFDLKGKAGKSTEPAHADEKASEAQLDADAGAAEAEQIAQDAARGEG